MVELIVKICSHAPYTPLVLRGLACIFLGRMKTDIERRAGSGKSTLTFQNPSAQLCSAMAQLSPLTPYTESYVDSSHPSIQQAASVDAVAYLSKNDILTLEALVREIGIYLPTTDNLIRARDGLADWRAL